MSANENPVSASPKTHLVDAAVGRNQRSLRKGVIQASADLSPFMTETSLGTSAQQAVKGAGLHDIITRSYWPLLQALIARDTTSKLEPGQSRPTIGKVDNCGIEEDAMLDWIAAGLKKAGMNPEVIPVEKPGFGKQGVLVCSVYPKGWDQKRYAGKPVGMLLSGHVDTVPVIDKPQDPFLDGRDAHLAQVVNPDQKDWAVAGRGTIDMKGGDAANLTVLALMHQHRDQLKEPFHLVLTPLEEVGGDLEEDLRTIMAKRGIHPRLVVLPEAGLANRVMAGCAGMSDMHFASATNLNADEQDKAVRASADFLRKIQAMENEFKHDSKWQNPAFAPAPVYPALNPYIRRGADFASNVVPAVSVVRVTVPVEHKAAVKILFDRVSNERTTSLYDLQAHPDRVPNSSSIKCPPPALEETRSADGNTVTYTVTFHGVPCHSSRPYRGINADLLAASFIEKVGELKGVRFHAPEGYYGPNVRFGLSWRPLTDEQAGEIARLATDAANASFCKYGLSNPSLHQRPSLNPMQPMTEEMRQSEVVQNLFQDVANTIGASKSDVQDAVNAGWAEMRYYQQIFPQVPAVCWGPHEAGTWHKDNEHMEGEFMTPLVKGLIGMSARVCGVSRLQDLARQDVTLDPRRDLPILMPKEKEQVRAVA